MLVHARIPYSPWTSNPHRIGFKTSEKQDGDNVRIDNGTSAKITLMNRLLHPSGVADTFQIACNSIVLRPISRTRERLICIIYRDKATPLLRGKNSEQCLEGKTTLEGTAILLLSEISEFTNPPAYPQLPYLSTLGAPQGCLFQVKSPSVSFVQLCQRIRCALKYPPI
ncbi:unnamed protein product [Nezara viridula]|uniref:Uncharacterized protein n=1 Tax=Nezara viridula TaxID=85310 RepID=A0A9P0MRS0_NEZVI|nr:unnamed protein product [Nezara viridula]